MYAYAYLIINSVYTSMSAYARHESRQQLTGYLPVTVPIWLCHPFSIKGKEGFDGKKKKKKKKKKETSPSRFHLLKKMLWASLWFLFQKFGLYGILEAFSLHQK